MENEKQIWMLTWDEETAQWVKYLPQAWGPEFRSHSPHICWVWWRPSGIPALLGERECRIRELTGPCRPAACCTRHHQDSLSQVRCKARTTTWGCALNVFMCACTHTDGHTLHKDNIKMNADQKTVEITTVKWKKTLLQSFKNERNEREWGIR